MIPPLAEEADLKRVLDLLDGVVLVGGADLDPRRDGFMLHPTVRPMEIAPRGFRPHVDRAWWPIAGCRCSASAPACNC